MEGKLLFCSLFLNFLFSFTFLTYPPSIWNEDNRGIYSIYLHAKHNLLVVQSENRNQNGNGHDLKQDKILSLMALSISLVKMSFPITKNPHQVAERTCDLLN